jgi:NAD(P)-dependent dehydrogenase (short-subunit alcohol dehydrogenase family)
MRVRLQEAVLVTGASLSIGPACALHLDQAGYRVLATVRQEQDAAALRRSRGSHRKGSSTSSAPFGRSPDVVVRAVLKALKARTPRKPYPVGADATILTWLPPPAASAGAGPTPFQALWVAGDVWWPGRLGFVCPVATAGRSEIPAPR